MPGPGGGRPGGGGGRPGGGGGRPGGGFGGPGGGRGPVGRGPMGPGGRGPMGPPPPRRGWGGRPYRRGGCCLFPFVIGCGSLIAVLVLAFSLIF